MIGKYNNLMVGKDYLTNTEQLRGVRIHKVLGLPDVGRRVMIRCPFHEDRTASLALYPNNSYYCFGCRETGQNAIDFCMSLGYTFKEAIEELKKY